MANDRFNTACPSCEASIAVRVASVGKKIECPKCKFRFVVKEGSGGTAPSAKSEAKSDKTATKTKEKGKKAKATGGSNSKVLIGVLVGVLALGGLAYGAYLIFGNDSKSNTQANAPAGGRGASEPVRSGQTPMGENPMGENPMGENPMGENPTPMGENPMGNPKPETPVKATDPKRPRSSGADVTNLLPNESKSVLHINMEEFAKTPLKNSFFDSTNKKMFKQSLRFDVEDVAEFIHCYVGNDYDPFAVIRTKIDLEEKIISVPEMDTELPVNSPIKGKWHFREIRSNAFLTAFGKSVNLPDLLGISLLTPTPIAAETNKKLAVCLYDPRTMLIAESNTLQRFLSELNDEGYPKFLHDYKKVSVEEPPTESTENPMSGAGPGEGGPGSRDGGGDDPRRRQQQRGGRSGGPPGAPDAGPGGPGIQPGGPGIQIQPPGGPGGPAVQTGGGPGGPGAGPGGAGTPGARAKTQKPITSNPSYRSVSGKLKKALNRLQDEASDQTAVLYASEVNQKAVNRYDFKGILAGADDITTNIMKQVKVAGLAVTRLSNTRGSFAAYLDYTNDAEAKKAMEEHLLPLLGVVQLAYELKFKESLMVVNENESSSQPGGFPGGPDGFPGGPGGFPGGPGGFQPGAPGGPGIQLQPGGPGGRGPGVSSGGGGAGKDPSSDAQAPRKGGGSEDAQGKGGGIPGPGEGGPPGGIQLGGPGGRGGFGGPGPGEGGPGGESGFMPTPPSGSRIEIFQSDNVVTLMGEFLWKREAYDSVVGAILNRSSAQLRGKMAVFSGDTSIYAFADREDGRPGVVKRLITQKGQFPQGALEREIESDRRGLPYPAEQRFSFFVDLLPYLDKGTIYSKIGSLQKPWYATENLPAAEMWVPELLVPDYPASAWRATNELIPEGRIVGATNYVGVAGVSLDAARLNPKNPDHAKKVGLIGYSFGSKKEEVTDGLGNTMFLIQVPPGFQRPWIAGGGATLMGVDDQGSDPARPFLTKRADGSRSTTVLMGDGSVRTVREGIDPAVFRAMATRAGGETIPDFDKVAPKTKPSGMVSELQGGPK